MIADVTAAHQTPASVVMVISPERLHPYMTHCLPDQETALELYRWNALASTAYWETLGHLEVALRNTLANRLAKRHRNKQRPGSWLDDRAGELDTNAKADIRKARRRIHEKGNRPGEGQTISELSFGFWRFLLASSTPTSGGLCRTAFRTLLIVTATPSKSL